MEDATGRSFGDLMQEEVLDRVPMASSTFSQSLPSGRGVMAACGHGFDGIPVKHCGNIYPETAAAWLWSTPTDLARLGIMLSDSLDGRSTTVLSQATKDLMLTKGLGDMGLGPGVHGEKEGLHFDHAGWNRGFRAYLLVYPHTGKGIVVMANADGGNELIDEVVRSAARTYQWPDFAPQRREIAATEPAVLDSHVGDYEVREYGIVLSVKRKDDHLLVDTPRGSSYTFYPATGSDYFAIEDGSELTFIQGPEGTEPALRVWGMVALRR
jgi:CubicO group peptidase (beta-lactamase class C family)